MLTYNPCWLANYTNFVIFLLMKEESMPDHIALQLTENTKKSPEKNLYTPKGRFPDNGGSRENPPSFPSVGKTYERFSFSKPKSRFVEEDYNPSLIFESPCLDASAASPDQKSQAPATEEDEKESLNGDDEKYWKEKHRLWWRTVFEWAVFVVMVACLTCSLTLGFLKHRTIWGLEIWKWFLMFLVMFCGRLVSGWLIWLTVFIIERRYMFKYKVLYFVYGLRKSVQNCVWLALVLLVWTLVINTDKIDSSSKYDKFLQKVSKALVALLVGAGVWLVKIILVKLLASSFHVNTFFDRIQESIFHHYILETLSAPPSDEITKSVSWKPVGLSLQEKFTGSKRWWGSKRMDVDTLRMLSQKEVSAWDMKRLVKYVRSSGFSTISRTVDEMMIDDGKTESEIKTEKAAMAVAKKIFEKVARPGFDFIEVDELLSYFKKKEVYTMIPLFEGAAETRKIQKSVFNNWVVRAYIERKALAHALNDTKTAVLQLHRLASAVVCVIIIVLCLLVTGVATTKLLLIISSQLLLVGFIFSNTCKTIFESIIFVFVMHPFDVGDRCVIDGVQMVVEEMNILTTIFLRYDNEKIYYPNSVLLTKPISNFYRSPDMGDNVEFSVDVETPTESVNDLKKCIQKYIESKPDHWRPKHLVAVKEIENMNKMKMVLYVTHTMNHQNYGEKVNRRSELVLALKDFFKKLDIRYNLLPQEVRLRDVSSATARIPPHTRAC